MPNPEVCATYFAVGALTWIDATFDPLSAPKTDPNSRVVCSAPFQVRGIFLDVEKIILQSRNTGVG